MKLLVGTLEESFLREERPFFLSGKSDMDRRRAGRVTQADEAAGQRGADGRFVVAGADQKPRTGSRRKRNRSQELGIIAPTGAFVGICPAVIEDIFTLRV